MFLVLPISVLIASVASFRLDTNGLESVATTSQTKFGASCEDLHTMFHSRVLELQALLDAHPNEGDFTRATQARFIMRSFGVVRTLRRSRTCSWVVEGDSEDIQQTRAIVQTLLAGNPCAEAARAELEAGASAETAELEIESVRRAMSVLMSDNCEPTEPAEESAALVTDDEAALDAQLVEAEAQAQDSIEEMVDAVEREDIGGSFAQTDSNLQWSFRGIMRALGVVFLSLLLLLACTSAVAIIGVLLGLAFALATVTCVGHGCVYFGYAHMGVGLLVGSAVGIAGCSYQLYAQLAAPASH